MVLDDRTFGRIRPSRAAFMRKVAEEIKNKVYEGKLSSKQGAELFEIPEKDFVEQMKEYFPMSEKDY